MKARVRAWNMRWMIILLHLRQFMNTQYIYIFTGRARAHIYREAPTDLLQFSTNSVTLVLVSGDQSINFDYAARRVVGMERETHN